MLDVVRPFPFLGLKHSSLNGEIKIEKRLVNAAIRPSLAWSTWVLDGGAIPSSIPCICPGRSDFSWSWGESNPSADVCVVPGQGLSSLATIRFRVSVSDRHLPGMAGV